MSWVQWECIAWSPGPSPLNPYLNSLQGGGDGSGDEAERATSERVLDSVQCKIVECFHILQYKSLLAHVAGSTAGGWLFFLAEERGNEPVGVRLGHNCSDVVILFIDVTDQVQTWVEKLVHGSRQMASVAWELSKSLGLWRHQMVSTTYTTPNSYLYVQVFCYMYSLYENLMYVLYTLWIKLQASYPRSSPAEKRFFCREGAWVRAAWFWPLQNNYVLPLLAAFTA